MEWLSLNIPCTLVYFRFKTFFVFYFQTCISEVTAAYDRELLYKANEPFIIKMQALVRGYQARKRYSDRVNFMMKHMPAILRLQVG